jgi:pimeloyl-ACP methyl ester carboxylesterase
MRELVMIPALGCNEMLYAPQQQALSGDVRIHSHIPTENTFAAMVKAIIAASPERFTIMGTSMGGRLALETALSAPERVEGLVIIGSGPGATADQQAGLRRSDRIRNGEFEQVVTEMAAMIAHLPGPRGQVTRDAFIAMCRVVGPETMARQSDALAHRVDRWPRLPEITCPVLLIWGNHDKFSSPAEGQRMNREISSSSLTILNECGHFPTLEYPSETTGMVRTWLQKHDLT